MINKKIAACFVLFFAMGIIPLVSGCGGGGSSSDACVKNPWLSICGGSGTATITGRVLIDGGLTLSRAVDREAALTSTQALSNATVGLYTMGSDGSLIATAFPTATTNTSGNFTLTGVTAGTHYILKATRTISTTTYTVYGVVSIAASQYGATVSASDMTTETTFAVAGLMKVVSDYNTGLTGASVKLLSAFSSTDVNSLITLVNSNLQTQVTATTVDLTGVHTNTATLATQFDNLQAAVPSLDTLVTTMSTSATDTTPPSTPTNVADGTGTDVDTQTSTTQLSANWSASTDSESGIARYYYSIGTTSGASDTVVWTDNGTATTFTKTGLTLTTGTTYYVSVKAENGAGLIGSVATSDGVAISALDTTAPQVSSFSPASGTTTVPANGASFAVVFTESMDISVSMNNQATLTASGISFTIQNTSSGVSLTIDTTNALAYGSFAWATTTNANDTLRFTLKSNANLLAGGLKTLKPGDTYNITNISLASPSNLKDLSANTLNTTTNIPTGGSFTVSTDSTAPQVSSFYPTDGTTNVANDQPVFKVIFNESMLHTIDLNNGATLTASGFSITLQKLSTGTTLTVDASNATSYGSFHWMTTSVPNDTLAFILKSNAILAGGGLKTIDPSTTYNITSRTVPTNLQDYSGNALNTVTNIPSTGSFTTRP